MATREELLRAHTATMPPAAHRDLVEHFKHMQGPFLMTWQDLFLLTGWIPVVVIVWQLHS